MAGNIGQIGRLIPQPLPTPKAADVAPGSGEDFKTLVGDFINSVNDVQNAAGDAQKEFLAGDDIALHEVMIKGEEAGVAMDLLLEIRNRLVNGFKEIMRMPM